MPDNAGKGETGKGKGQGVPRLPIPAEVLAIAQTLDRAGFETWCVGGAVRDNLLGLPNADFDLATAATPAEVQKLFRRTVPVGAEHGTIGVLDAAGTLHEVTTFRRDVKTDGRHAVVEFGVSLDDDLARRDFTINAIAYHPLKHDWRDPFKGQEDLDGKLVRAVGDPAQRFREDYLRILRALRFAARFGFAIEPATLAAAKAESQGLAHLSAERVRDEWVKGLSTAKKASELVRQWRDVGAVKRWLTELRTGELELGTGNLELGVVDRLPPDPVLITAFLSADPVATLTRLRCSNAEIERGRKIAAARGELPDAADRVAVRRWLARVGAAADDLVAIAVAEGKGEALRGAVQAERDAHVALSVGDLAVNGNDLIQAGIPKGPAIGATLKALLERVLDKPELNEKKTLLELARK